MTKRQAMTKARRLRIIERQNGLCAKCELPLGSDTEIDHRISLFVSADESDDNLEALHKACHLSKSKTDWKAHAKIKRLIARQEGTRRPRKAIAGRGFDKGLTKKFSGEVVRRPR